MVIVNVRRMDNKIVNMIVKQSLEGDSVQIGTLESNQVNGEWTEYISLQMKLATRLEVNRLELCKAEGT
jgi:hypothetical protein